MIKKLAGRYRFFLCTLSATIIITLFSRQVGLKTFFTVGSSIKQMLSVLPPIMLLLGLMDVWIPREKMMKFMGEDSGVTGITLAVLIGSIAAGPMYAAFPFTAVMLRKGVKFSNIIIFMNAWCVTKITTLLFEITALGYRFTFIRLLIDLPGVIIMGYVIQWLMSNKDLEEIYINAEKID